MSLVWSCGIDDLICVTFAHFSLNTVEPPWAATSRKRPPNQNPDWFLSQSIINETSRKRPPDITGGRLRKVPLYMVFNRSKHIGQQVGMYEDSLPTCLFVCLFVSFFFPPVNSKPELIYPIFALLRPSPLKLENNRKVKKCMSYM